MGKAANLSKKLSPRIIHMEYSINKFGAIVPEKVTSSLLNFLSEMTSSEFFMVIFMTGNDFLQKNKEAAKKELFNLYNDEENKHLNSISELFSTEKGDILLDLSTYELFYGQMAYARAIDNAITYFKDILSEVILKEPKILKSSEKEKLDFILSFDSISELRSEIARKKIEALFYLGIDKIEEYFKSRLGIEIFKTSEAKADFEQAVKSRNLIVHNRGRVNKDYEKKYPKSKLKEGDLISFSYPELSYWNVVLANFIVLLDEEIANKYGLTLTDRNEL